MREHDSVRVIYLSTAFPKPESPDLGPWGLRQARALGRHGATVLVVSPTTWMPRWAGRLGVKRATALCPREHDWDGLRAMYPRWLYTQRGDDADIVYNYPGIFNALGWVSGRAALLRIVRQFRPHLIHANHMTPSGVTAWRLGRATGIPFVLTEHNLKEIEHYRSRPPRRAIGGRVVPAAARWIALGRPVEREMKLAFPQARTVIVPNGTDRPPPELLAANRPAELGGRLVVCCVAGFYPTKNIPALVRGFARAAGTHANAVLRICGDGEQRVEIERTIRACGLEQRVTLLGGVSHARAMEEMAGADVFALVSIQDTYPTVCLEAASVGCPQVWPFDGSVGDRLKDGVHGYAIDPRSDESIAHALVRLLGDAAARSRMRAASLGLFEEELSWDVAAPRLVSVYREVVAEAAATGSARGPGPTSRP